jgi:tetratricopeptide (TPR) repeat protein
MKKRTAAIAAFLSLMSIGQALVIGSGAALTSAVVMLFVPEKAQAEYSDVYFYRGRDKYHDGDYYGAISDYTKSNAINPNSYSYYFMAKAKKKIGDMKGACADWRKVYSFGYETGALKLVRKFCQ